MKRIVHAWLVLGMIALVFSSCSQKTEVPQPVQRPIYIGKVDHVYPSKNYVLIRLYGNVPEEGTTLISHAPDGDTYSRMANLCVSAERLGRLRVPADIRSGKVMAGDLVFQYQNMASPNIANQPYVPEPDTPPTTKQDVTTEDDDDFPPSSTPTQNETAPENQGEQETVTPASPLMAPDLPGQADDLGDIPSRIEEEY